MGAGGGPAGYRPGSRLQPTSKKGPAKVTHGIAGGLAGAGTGRILRCRAMNIWGKLLGGGAGFAIGGPIRGLLGAVAAHAVDRLAESDQAPDDVVMPGVDERAATRQIAFTIGIIVLGAKMAKADGVVSRSEILAFK